MTTPKKFSDQFTVTVNGGKFKNRISQIAYYFDQVIPDLLKTYMINTYAWSKSDLEALRSFTPYDEKSLTLRVLQNPTVAKKMEKLFRLEFPPHHATPVPFGIGVTD